jgi:hypothetical protein
LILLAFLLPLGVYLLALGLVNRRPRPVLVGGVWDFIGLLFAASGFILFGGPAALSGLEERWRLYWLLGQRPGAASGAGEGWPLWALLSGAYFVVVVAGCALLLARRRRLTAIYNVAPPALQQVLDDVFCGLGLDPMRSGNLFLFGLAAAKGEGTSAPHEPFQGPHNRLPNAPTRPERPDLAGEAAVLEVETFPALNHATLCWDPADTPLRREVENGLARLLRGVPAPPSEFGGWMVLAGSTLVGFTAVASVGLVALHLWAASK